jgi:adenosyl cobinamide kinase/adenosyl cobinamide phosphate guanylyltransferase
MANSAQDGIPLNLPAFTEHENLVLIDMLTDAISYTMDEHERVASEEEGDVVEWLDTLSSRIAERRALLQRITGG